MMRPSMMRRPLFLATSMIAVVVTGCSLAPTYQRPDAPVPAQWPSSGQGNAVTADTGTQNVPVIAYRDVFRDPQLDYIVQRALVENRDLRIAVANTEMVRAQYRIQRAAQLPSVSGGLSATIGENASVNNGNGGRVEQYTVDVGLNAFEIDLFGRLRNQSAAALNEYLATEAGAHAARLTLVSEIARAYVAYATDQTRLRIAEGAERAAVRPEELINARREAGLSSRLELRQAQTILGQARADIAGLRAQIEQDRNALDLLVGTPLDSTVLPRSLDQIFANFGEPATNDLNTYVLLRRPDVVSAEYRLKAANARIGAARAALLPRLSLSALIGWTGGSMSTIFNGQDPNWSLQPAMRATLFDMSVKGGVDLTWAQRDLYVAQYERAIQAAFREVGDALARKATIEDEIAANQSRVDAATDTYELSFARFKEGADPYLPTLDAQRQLYAAQQVLLQSQRAQVENIIALYRTLGGEIPAPASR